MRRIAVYLLGIAGLSACLAAIFIATRAVLDVGGFCAEGGPFVIAQRCPPGTPLLVVGGIFGIFLFGGLTAWGSTGLGRPYEGLIWLAWPALFLSLAWNFLEAAVTWPGGGIGWGALITGVFFVALGGGPLLLALRKPTGGADRSAAAARLATLMARKSAAARSAGNDAEATVGGLERLAALHQSGALSEAEYAAAKARLLAGEDQP